MNIENHLLKGKNISQKETPNTSGLFNEGLPDSLVMHYTAGSSIEGAVASLTNPNIKASAHIVIGRNGDIVQLAPFNTVTWHAGKSKHLDRNGLNKFSIGIELDNAGLLHKTADGYVSWFNRTYPEKEVMKARHRNETEERYWPLYTEQQLIATRNLCALLVNTYSIQYILGHEEISPGRKSDPGPAFPLDKLRNDLLLDVRDEDEVAEQKHPMVSVNTSELNIRSGAGTSFPQISAPLQNGTPLTVLEEKDGWLKVSTELTGWVAKDYVKAKP
jgi:N-acetylmuramoyl-L-alanine amidase